MILHKLSDTTKVITFLMVDSTDHLTGKTGLSPTVTKSENGGAFGAVAGTVAEIGNGWYKLTPASGDVDTLGVLLLHATGTAADPVDIAVQVVAFDPYDAAALGLTVIDTEIAAIKAKTDALPADPADASDIATATTTIAGYIDTEVASILAAVDTEVAAIKTKTDQLTFSTSNRIDAQVFGIEAGAITAASIATGAIDADAIASDAVTEIQSGLATAAALDTVDNLLDTEVAAIKAVTDKLDTAMELDTSVYRFTTNALEQAPAGGGGGSADWTADEKTAIRTILGVPASGTTPEAPSAGALKVIDDFLDTEMAATLAAVDTEVAAIKAKTDNLPASPANEATLTTIAGYLDTEVAATLAAVDTEVAAIKAKTDNLPSSPAAVGSAMTLAQSERDELRGYDFDGDETITYPDGSTATVTKDGDGTILSVTVD